MYLENLNALSPILWVIIGLLGVSVLAIVIISIVSKSQARKQSNGQSVDANMQVIEEEKKQEAAKRNLSNQIESQRQAAIRKEVFEKLAAQGEGYGEEPAKKEETAAVVEETKAPAKKAAAKKAPVKKETAKEEVAAAAVVEEKPVEKKAPAKKAPVKKEAVKEEAPVVEEKPALTDDSDTDALARYAGKWAVYHILTDDNSEDDMYFFELHASNGEKLLASEEYTSYQGAVRGIETHKNNILKGNFKITLSKKGDYIVKLLSGSGQLLCTGENYANKARCESAIKSIKRFARTAIVDENVQDFFLKVPKDDESYVEPVADGVNGKWIISNREDSDGDKVFYFELFANNGEKLLSSEEYTTYAGAVNGLQTHKTNIAKGNFRITLTKKGDYIYKILNGNGQLLCLGEHYKSKSRCQSAVDSVKRFAESSPVLTDSDQRD